LGTPHAQPAGAPLLSPSHLGRDYMKKRGATGRVKCQFVQCTAGDKINHVLWCVWGGINPTNTNWPHQPRDTDWARRRGREGGGGGRRRGGVVAQSL
jgi:hypothetical protein